ncbi:hypothetical protein DL96DRAFT_1575065 [Flagelloscypha sp. PMI_526]|nr:hypothetical protein DL96DRAFT_1575065 [Flagelloscypha sp. PMI_526]
MSEEFKPPPLPPHPEPTEPAFQNSKTGRQIYKLSMVEKDLSHLLTVASNAMNLLSLPQMDSPDDNLAQGLERQEAFVAEASVYFALLDRVQETIKSMLAHIKDAKITPSKITAPPPGFVPPSLGVGRPVAMSDEEAQSQKEMNRGLQEERVERDAWKAILKSLTKLQEGLVEPSTGLQHTSDVHMDDPK